MKYLLPLCAVGALIAIFAAAVIDTLILGKDEADQLGD